MRYVLLGGPASNTAVRPGDALGSADLSREDFVNEIVRRLKVKLYADGADMEAMGPLAADPFVAGFTTNPTLMRAAGVTDYAAFVKELTSQITDKPISFEVFADDFDEMERQAHSLSAIADNVYVKIPITNTAGDSSVPLMGRLAAAGVSINATALMTPDQVRGVAVALAGGPPAIVSVFAGRVADAGVDPVPIMAESAGILEPHPELSLLWASPREVLNVLQADRAGCDIITCTPPLLSKLSNLGRDLTEFSLATVRMFRDDAVAAEYDF
jgi:transaldolase